MYLSAGLQMSMTGEDPWEKSAQIRDPKGVMSDTILGDQKRGCSPPVRPLSGASRSLERNEGGREDGCEQEMRTLYYWSASLSQFFIILL